MCCEKRVIREEGWDCGVEGVLPLIGWSGKALLGRLCVSEEISPVGIRGKNVPARAYSVQRP